METKRLVMRPYCLQEMMELQENETNEEIKAAWKIMLHIILKRY